MTKWWHVSWKRVSKVLLVIFLTPLFLLGVLALVRSYLAPWRTARSFAAEYPDLGKVPAAPPTATLANLSGEKISHFGFSVQLPWREIRRDQVLHDTAMLSAPNGGLLTIQDPSTSHFPADTLHLLASQVPALRSQSNYALTVAAMNATPEKVKWWRTPSQNAMDFDLLLMKNLLETECHGPVYVIQFGGMRGFQQGNPAAAPYCAKLMLFDSADRLYEFTFGVYPEDTPIVTQAEVNAMVASLVPISQQ